MTPAQLKAVMPKADAITWAPALTAAMAEFGIDAPTRIAAFLAQLAHESLELTVLEERLSYSADRLLAVWPKRFTPTTAQLYARRPEALANYVYANRNGNGDELSGDGWRFRGRGPIQLTGRANYAKAGDALTEPLETAPDKASLPNVGARIAAWYWKAHGLNALADVGDFGGITKAINGGLTGLAEREAYYRRAKAALG